jgi:hypothetical protein
LELAGWEFYLKRIKLATYAWPTYSAEHKDPKNEQQNGNDGENPEQ